MKSVDFILIAYGGCGRVSLGPDLHSAASASVVRMTRRPLAGGHGHSGGDGIPAELFQILKDDAVKVLHSIWQHIWKTQQWPQEWKRSVFIPIPKKGPGEGHVIG